MMSLTTMRLPFLSMTCHGPPSRRYSVRLIASAASSACRATSTGPRYQPEAVGDWPEDSVAVVVGAVVSAVATPLDQALASYLSWRG